MTHREKLLAGGIGLLVLLLFSFYLVNWISNAFDSRDNRLLSLQGEVQRQHRQVTAGKIAERQLQEYRHRSLPADRPIAESLYQKWLVDRVNQAGLTGVSVNPRPALVHRDLYSQHSWNITGNGKLGQLIRFLHEFYSVDYLHRIGSLTALPIRGVKQLKITINIDALSLSKSENKELPVRSADRLAFKQVQPYVEAIAHRNFFAPANKPPQFDPPRGQRGNPKQPFTVRLGGKDPDGDELRYSLVSETSQGAEVNPQNGEFRWTPSELGDYEFEICVTDSGLPPKSVTKTLTVSVVQPPAKAPGFDAATMAKFTGVTDSDGHRLVWIHVQTEGRQLLLKKGDRLDVGSVRGVIREIRLNPREFECATDDGRVVTVRIGKTLVSSGSSPITGIQGS